MPGLFATSHSNSQSSWLSFRELRRPTAWPPDAGPSQFFDIGDPDPKARGPQETPHGGADQARWWGWRRTRLEPTRSTAISSTDRLTNIGEPMRKGARRRTQRRRATVGAPLISSMPARSDLTQQRKKRPAKGSLPQPAASPGFGPPITSPKQQPPGWLPAPPTPGWRRRSRRRPPHWPSGR